MLDTITLNIPHTQFEITNHNKFNPSTKDLFEPPYRQFGGKAYTSSIQNPNKKEIEQNGYMPRLTVTKSLPRGKSGGFSINLKIEFSAPKLFFGNNFNELNENNFNDLCIKLRTKLFKMGVETSLESIKLAKISKIHYSKNIIIDDYTRCTEYINNIANSDLRSNLDLNHTDYKNGGHSIKFHANSYEIAFYDKRKDLEASEKRAIENDNYIQDGIISNLPKHIEILRMEARLNETSKIKTVINSLKLGIKEFNFSNLFSKKVAKHTLLSYWNKIENNIKMHDLSQNKAEDILFALEQSDNKISVAKTLKLIGLANILKDRGIRGVRSMFGSHLSPSAWSNLKKEMLSIEPLLEQSRSNSNTKKIRESLNAFDSVNIEDHSNSN